MTGFEPALRDVPETALWTLYHRAEEARRGGVFRDPEAIRIVEAIDYPFRRRFGPPTPAFAGRALAFDREVQAFLTAEPTGQVVCLGEGLETQRFRVDNGRVKWMTVDLPQSVEVRERFIRPDERHVHVACDATDTTWLNAVNTERPCLMTAQGLLMYLSPTEVRTLFQRIAERCPNCVLVFDAIPPWLRWWTRKGWPTGPRYSAPPMDWTLRANEQDVLRAWIPGEVDVEIVPYAYPRPRVEGWLTATLAAWPGLRRWLPTIFKVRFGPAKSRTRGGEHTG